MTQKSLKIFKNKIRVPPFLYSILRYSVILYTIFLFSIYLYSTIFSLYKLIPTSSASFSTPLRLTYLSCPDIFLPPDIPYLSAILCPSDIFSQVFSWVYITPPQKLILTVRVFTDRKSMDGGESITVIISVIMTVLRL